MQNPAYLPDGTTVRVTSVDPYGYCGRVHHPTPADVGRVGTVTGAWVGCGPVSGPADYTAAVTAAVADGTDDCVSYMVEFPGDDIREFMWFEVDRA